VAVKVVVLPDEGAVKVRDGDGMDDREEDAGEGEEEEDADDDDDDDDDDDAAFDVVLGAGAETRD